MRNMAIRSPALSKWLRIAGVAVTAAAPCHAQSKADSTAVVEAVLAHIVSSDSSLQRIGIVPHTFSPNRIVNGIGTGFRWNVRSPVAGLAAAIAANPRKLRVAPAFDSIPRICVATFSFRSRPRGCGRFRDYDAVVSLSSTEFDGAEAMLYVREDRNSGANGQMTWYRYDIEWRNGKWVVAKAWNIYGTSTGSRFL